MWAIITHSCSMYLPYMFSPISSPLYLILLASSFCCVYHWTLLSENKVLNNAKRGIFLKGHLWYRNKIMYNTIYVFPWRDFGCCTPNKTLVQILCSIFSWCSRPAANSSTSKVQGLPDVDPTAAKMKLHIANCASRKKYYGNIC